MNWKIEHKKGRSKKNPKILYLGWFFGLFISFFLVQSSSAIANLITFQGKLTDSAGSTVTDGTYYLKLNIYDALIGGSCQYAASGTCGTPTTVPVTVTSGIFSINLGDTGSSLNALPSTLFNTDALYLGLTVCTGSNSGCDSEMTPRKRITASPYSFNSDRLSGLATSSQGGNSSYIPATDSSGNLSLSNSLYLATSTSGKLGIGTSTVPSGTKAFIDSTTATDKLLVVRANASQSGNLTEWQNNSGTALVSINPSGNISTSGTIYTTYLSGFPGATALTIKLDSDNESIVFSESTGMQFSDTGGLGMSFLTNSAGINFGGSLLASSNDNFDLGAYGKAWKDVYTSGTMRFGGPMYVGLASGYNLGKFSVDSSGNTSVSGTLRIFGSTTSTGNLYPSVNNIYDIGAEGHAWKDLFVSGTIRLPGTASASEGVIMSGNSRILHNYGTSNIFLGVNAGNFTTTGAGGNVGVGSIALQNLSSGVNNTAVGGGALKLNNTGGNNTAVGSLALSNNFSGSENVALGALSLGTNTAGYNTGIGYNALYNNLTGNYNTALGHSAGYSNSAGSSNVFLGYQAGYYETGSNKLYIDNSNTAAPLLYGEFDNNILQVFNNLGVGPTSTLAMRGPFYVNSSGNISTSGTLSVFGNLSTINNASYTWPSSYAGGSTCLINNGSGALTWGACSGSSATNDWGRFATTYGASALMTSSTYPVWFDSAVYTSSTLIASGNNTFGNSDAAGGNTTRILGSLAMGAAPTGNAQLFIQATSTTAIPLAIRVSANDDVRTLLQLQTSSGGNAIDLNVDNDSGYIQISDASAAVGRTLIAGSVLITSQISGTYDQGKFYVDPSGNVSASGTLNVSTIGSSDAAGGDTTRIYGSLAMGAAPTGNAQLFIQATSTTASPLVIKASANADLPPLIRLQSSVGGNAIDLNVDNDSGYIQLADASASFGRSLLTGGQLIVRQVSGSYDRGYFSIDISGNVSTSGTLSVFGDLNRINNVAYSFPSSQGGANTYLKNNGSGTLTWATVSGSGTNDWGRFESTFDTMSLRTSSTYPVWLDRAFVSSTLIVGGSAGGADDSGLLIYAGAQDSGSELFAIYDKAGRSLLSFATSSNWGASVLTVGNLTSPSAGGNIVLNAGTEGLGGLFVMGQNNDFNNVFAALTGESEGGMLMLGSGNVTSTFSASYLQLGETWDSNGEPIDNGKFYVDATNGNTSTSGTLRVWGGSSANLLIGITNSTTTLTSSITDAAGSTGFAFNTVASSGVMTSGTDRMLAVFQNNGTNKVMISAGGNVYAKDSFIANSTSYGIGDVAEYVNLTPGETTEAGDVLVVDTALSNSYKKSDGAYAKNVAGVISDTGKFVMGASGDNRVALALAGLVKVKVTNENGAVNPGDYLITSSKPGFAMKYDPATSNDSAGLVGMALEPLIGEEGKVTILVNKGLVAGKNNNLSMKVDGDGQLVDEADLDLVGGRIINVSSIGSVSGIWQIDEEGNMVAKNIKADKVQTKELVLEKDQAAEKSTIGEATVKEGQNSVEVLNEKVKTSSKIFVTFHGNPGSFWWISNQEDGKFSISLSSNAAQDIVFDYWLINIFEQEKNAVEENGGGDQPANPETPVGDNGGQVNPETPAPEDSTPPVEEPANPETPSQETPVTPPVEEPPAVETPPSEAPPAETSIVETPPPAPESAPEAPADTSLVQ